MATKFLRRLGQIMKKSPGVASLFWIRCVILARIRIIMSGFFMRQYCTVFSFVPSVRRWDFRETKGFFWFWVHISLKFKNSTRGPGNRLVPFMETCLKAGGTANPSVISRNKQWVCHNSSALLKNRGSAPLYGKIH